MTEAEEIGKLAAGKAAALKAERAVDRKRREAEHNAALHRAAKTRDMTVTGLRLSNQRTAEGVVVVFDEAEQKAIMEAVRAILFARERAH